MFRHFAVLAALFWSVVVYAAQAQAYPWMIRHEYNACATCHTDPSGAGLLTAYGRAQSRILLSSHYRQTTDEEPGSGKDFLFGLAPLPDWLLLQGWLRNGYMWNNVNGHVDSRFLPMRDDLGAHVTVGALRASATIGYNTNKTAVLSEQAWVTSASPHGNLVSREHWVGLALAEDSLLVRLGRINLPFGLRNIEHTAWVRSETRTDINQGQQHGVAVAYTGERWRGELMGIAGNFQVHPDAYRERGYAAFAEFSVAPRYGVGACSLVTHATADILTQTNTTRQAHGIFARAAPIQALVLLGEFDALLVSSTGTPGRTGYVGFLQLDAEPIQGVHGMVTSEILNRGGPTEHTNVGLWLSAAWFPLPHLDARADVIRRTSDGAPATLTYLLQLQAYL
jgi:hypothetical protein